MEKRTGRLHFSLLVKWNECCRCVMMISFVLVYCSFAEYNGELHTSCETKTDGQSAEVTCLFSVDLNSFISVGGIVVQRYSFNKSDEPAEVVVECFWSSKQTFLCLDKDGYDYDRKVSSNLTLTIPVMSSRFEGKYVCQVVPPPDTDSAAFCSLRLPDRPDKTSTECASTSTSTSTFLPNATTPLVEESVRNNLVVILSTAVLCVFLILTIAVIIKIVKWRRLERRDRLRARQSSSEDSTRLAENAENPAFGDMESEADPGINMEGTYGVPTEQPKNHETSVPV